MSTVEVERPAERITVLRLNRPEQRNALNFTLVGELYDALDTVAADDDCRVVILTGAGTSFCAGLDLRDFGTPPDVGAHRHRHAGVSGQGFLANLTQQLHDTPQIVIVAVNGAAFGGGLALACACDLRIASDSASFCSAFIRTGMTGTDVGITYFLPRLIGAARAFDMILTGRKVDADEAERMGLVSRVCADDDLEGAAIELAERVAGFTSFGLRRTKEVLWHNLEAPSVAAAIAMENRNQELAVHEPEVLEYMRNYAARFRAVPQAGGATRAKDLR
jgi:enoyl-CoA hydratase